MNKRDFLIAYVLATAHGCGVQGKMPPAREIIDEAEDFWIVIQESIAEQSDVNPKKTKGKAE